MNSIRRFGVYASSSRQWPACRPAIRCRDASVIRQSVRASAALPARRSAATRCRRWAARRPAASSVTRSASKQSDIGRPGVVAQRRAGRFNGVSAMRKRRFRLWWRNRRGRSPEMIGYRFSYRVIGTRPKLQASADRRLRRRHIMNRTLVAAALACTTLAGCYYPYGYYPGGYYTAAPVPVQPAPVYVDPAPPTTIRRRPMRPHGAVIGAGAVAQFRLRRTRRLASSLT